MFKKRCGPVIIAAALILGCDDDPIPPASVVVVVAPNSVSLPVGGSAQLGATVTGAFPGSPLTVYWRTTNGQVVTVSAAGLASGVAPGTARIIAKAVIDTLATDTAVVVVQ